MNKYTWIVIVIIVLIVIIGGIYTSMNDEKADDAEITDEESEMNDSGLTANNDESATVAGVYEAYSPEKIARAETGDVVLFFHASWCPSCRALGANIEGNLESIPVGVSILKADYDAETELKKKYGVTYQHTLVQVDKDGNMIKKWSGSPNLNSIIAQIQ